MHLDTSARCVEHIRQRPRSLGQLILDVLARGEMAITLVPPLRDSGELPHLGAVERAIRHRYAQHVGVQLQVKPVHEAQRFEFILGERPVNAALHLCAELGVAHRNEGGVEIGIAVHQSASDCLPWG